MKFANKDRTLQWIKNQYDKGNISFKHRLQRPTGQWNSRMRGKLINSLLIGMPINPIYCVEEDGIIYALDGAQRTSICIEYMNNKFSLHKETPSVTLISNENGEKIERTYEIADKKFDDLDKEVQNSLLASSLTFCTMSEYTDQEVIELFVRQNSSKPVNGKLMRVCYSSVEFDNAVSNLTEHPFMQKIITKAQQRNGNNRDLIIQAIMLIATNDENDFTSFRSKDMDDFVINYADNYLDKFDTLREAMDRFDATFDEIKIPVTSISMILFCGYRCVKDKKGFSKLCDIIQKFLDEYDNNEEYKSYVESGTSGRDSVRPRLDYWCNIIRRL